jgi:hypothetical protein
LPRLILVAPCVHTRLACALGAVVVAALRVMG